MTLTFSLEIDQLKEMIEDKIAYSFLDKHIHKTNINLHKLSLLTIIMEETSLLAMKQKQYIIATMLVQIALDTHEHIPENKEVFDDQNEQLSKQLSVLGGDYYSSLYYVLLSESNDIEFIQTLASAIKDVNEKKMDLYFQTTTDLHIYLKLGKMIESHIISSVATYVGFKDAVTINMINDLLLLDLLIREKEQIVKNNNPFFFEHKQIQSQLFTTIDQIIDTSIKQFEQKLTNKSKFTHKLNKIFKNITHHYMVITEEG